MASRSEAALSSLEVLDIFRRKTAPAFEVALRLGAAFAGAEDDVTRGAWQATAKRSASPIRFATIWKISSRLPIWWQARPSLPLAIGVSSGRKAGEEALLERSGWTTSDGCSG